MTTFHLPVAVMIFHLYRLSAAPSLMVAGQDSASLLFENSGLAVSHSKPVPRLLRVRLLRAQNGPAGSREPTPASPSDPCAAPALRQADHAIRPHQDGALFRNAAIAAPRPGADRTDRRRCDRSARRRAECRWRRRRRPRRDPSLAFLAGDEQEAAGSDEVFQRSAIAGFVIDPGVRQRAAGTRARLVEPDIVDRLGFGRTVGTMAAD